MPSIAKYFPELQPDGMSTQKLFLYFDSIGSISPYFIDYTFTKAVTLRLSTDQEAILNIDDVNHYALLTGLMGKISTADNERVMDNLVSHINIAIENKVDVAAEIYQGWQRISDLLENSKITEEQLLEKVAAKILVGVTDVSNSQAVMCIYELISILFNNRAGLNTYSLRSTLTGSLLYPQLRLVGYYDVLMDAATDEDREVLEANQAALHKSIRSQTSNVYMSLAPVIELEISASKEECEESELPKLGSAIEQLLLGNFTHFTTNEKIAKSLETLHKKFLLFDRKTIWTFFNREENANINKLTIQDLIHLIRYCIFQATKSANIILDKSIVLTQFQAIYSLENLKNVIENLTIPFLIRTNTTDVFEHHFLKLFNIEQFPITCQFRSDESCANEDLIINHYTYAILSAAISSENMFKMNDSINDRYGENTAIPVPSNNPKYKSLRINMKTLLERIMPDWYSCLVESLRQNPRHLAAYRQLTIARPSTGSFLTVLKHVDYEISKTNSTDLTSRVIGSALLKAFNIVELPFAFAINQAEDRVDALLDYDIMFFKIPHTQIMKFVVNFKKEFPNAHVQVIASIDEKSAANLDEVAWHQIAIDKETLDSAEFLNHFLDKWEELMRVLAQNGITNLRNNSAEQGHRRNNIFSCLSFGIDNQDEQPNLRRNLFGGGSPS